MLLLAGVSLVLAHTPQNFYTSCPVQHVHLSDVGVSAVTYLTMLPYCNYTFDVEDKGNCELRVLSLHRFEKTTHTASIYIDGNKYTENVTEVSGEPFTLTPVVKTLELQQTKQCTFSIGDTAKGILVLVTGKSEDWWLFMTIPYYAARIQWQWAYAEWDFWFWGIAALAVLIITWPKRPAIAHTIAVLACTCLTDYFVRIITLAARVGWPSGGLWVAFLIVKALILVLHIYICFRFEIVHVTSTGPKLKTVRRTPVSIALFIFIYAISVGMGIGSYILQPAMFMRYTNRHNVHASKQKYRVVPAT